MKPKIFVFCNGCSPGWHTAQALSEDGCFIAGHVCSDHGYIGHDMGLDPNGWKHDIYQAHYPEGYEVVWVNDALNGGEEFNKAYERHKGYTKEEYEKRMSVHSKDNQPSVVIEMSE